MALLLGFLSFHLSAAEAQTTGTAEAPHAAWSYDGKRGPAWWGSLSAEYHQCKDGHRQSPVNLDSKIAFGVKGAPLKILYRPAPVDEFNDGHTIREDVHNHSAVDYDGRHYELVQFHFHSPSEHTLNGRQMALELHLVHRSDDGRKLVIGVFFEKGVKNAALEPVLTHLPKKVGDHTVDKDSLVNIKRFIPKRSAIYSYDGSLTTPPGTEDVRWFVFEKPLPISVGQLARFRKLYDHNFRPVQPLHGRMLTRFH